jgi:DNA-binding beta-propeller fold protein YncE
MRASAGHLLRIVSFASLLSLTVHPLSMAQEYLSPNSLCFNEQTREIYIGHATSPSVGVFDPAQAEPTGTIALPAPSNALCIDDQKQLLYVACKDNDSRVVVVDLRSKQWIRTIAVGYHPAALELTPDAQRLFVANRFSHDISEIATSTFEEIRRIPVDREPVAMALSPDGRRLAVANHLPSGAATEPFISAKISLFDVESPSNVHHVQLCNGSYALRDIAFSPDGKHIYATHLIGRFNVLTSQIEKGWINTNAVAIIDAESNTYMTSVLLDDLYRGAANPASIRLTPEGKTLLVTISGSHELFVIDREAMHRRIQNTIHTTPARQYVLAQKADNGPIPLFESPGHMEPPTVRFEEIPHELGFLEGIRTRVPLSGKGPGNILYAYNKAYITSYFSDALDIVDFSGPQVRTWLVHLQEIAPAMDRERYGEMLFHDASQCFQHWQSCASCHPGQGRTDGLNWDLMNDGFGNPKNTKSLLYSYATPPAMATGVREDAVMATRAGFKYIQFHSIEEDKAKAVDAWLASLEALPSPYLEQGKLSKSARKGKRLFESGTCVQCHSGPYFTDGQQHTMGMQGRSDRQNTWDTPTLLEVWRTAPYMHDGRYATLKEVFTVEKHGIEHTMTEEEIDYLVQYVLSL